MAGLLGTIPLSLAFGAAFYYCGRNASAHLYRPESLAIVGRSWCLASLLGALPFLVSGTTRSVMFDSVGRTVLVPMTIADAVFESASGFKDCGATVITDLENPELVPWAILFWRSGTCFLGGLEIMVLFVAIRGPGSTGKASRSTSLPRSTESGTTKDCSETRNHVVTKS